MFIFECSVYFVLVLVGTELIAGLVILILWDVVRVDHLLVYGYECDIMFYLFALVRESVVFECVYINVIVIIVLL